MLRAVQIGLGSWGTDWARRVLPSAPELAVTRHVDADPGQRRRFTEATGLPAAEGVDDADPFDAVLITASINAHGPLIRAALDLGKHVLVEKPFTLDLPEAVDLVTTAERRGRTLMVAQNYRFFPAAQAAARAIRHLGPVRHVRVRFRADHRYPTTTPSPDSSVLHQVAVHHFDLIRFLIGDITAVTAQPWSTGQAPDDLLSSFSAMLEAGSGTMVDYSASSTSSAARTAWSGEWFVEGRDAVLEWAGEADGESSYVRVHGLEHALEHGLDPADRGRLGGSAGEDRRRVVRQFVDTVDGGPDGGISGRANLGTVAAMVAAWDSIRSGRRVPVTVPGERDPAE